ncbi:hypothetical protein RCH10_004666 [Variovorax sp. GrIS 2.14]|uniref:hypothetical protein n=1 Tax=Variovorax sp. GrIS 2.14 TaxID=3071709 RepID=UPI0038F74CBA
MAMDLLRLLAASPLPAICRTPEEIDAVRLLRAAGLVIALTPPVEASSSSPETDHAVVLAITSRGREELQAFTFPAMTPTPPASPSGPSASWRVTPGHSPRLRR